MGMNDLKIPYQLIETAPDLEQAANLLSREEIIAVDLEARLAVSLPGKSLSDPDCHRGL